MRRNASHTCSAIRLNTPIFRYMLHWAQSCFQEIDKFLEKNKYFFFPYRRQTHTTKFRKDGRREYFSGHFVSDSLVSTENMQMQRQAHKLKQKWNALINFENKINRIALIQLYFEPTVLFLWRSDLQCYFLNGDLWQDILVMRRSFVVSGGTTN